MKQILLSLTIFFALVSNSFAQNRGIARGAEPGELYMAGGWYEIFYNTRRTAVYHITEYGKKLTIQYDYDSFYAGNDKMSPRIILADATPGVLYNRQYYPKNDGYTYTALWASFDHGKNWIFREENLDQKNYLSANIEGLIYSTGFDGCYKSEDYGANFSLLEVGTPGGEPGLQKEEFFGVRYYMFATYTLYHTYDLITFTEIPIDSQYVFTDPDVYRGGLPEEVYVISRFPDWTYHLSFSADTGHTFRKVFVSEPSTPDESSPIFMSDREPGVFYIIYGEFIQDLNPWGLHLKLCIHHYTDYGETLVDIYCHDIHKDYKNDVGVGELGITNYKLRVYPNPTTGEFTINNEQLTIHNIEIIDIYGKKVFEQKAEGRKQKEINISELKAGIYFVKITTEKGIGTQKIIKY